MCQEECRRRRRISEPRTLVSNRQPATGNQVSLTEKEQCYAIPKQELEPKQELVIMRPACILFHRVVSSVSGPEFSSSHHTTGDARPLLGNDDAGS